MGSIFLYSNRSGQCVELKVPEATPSDLARLHGALPRNVTGLSFTRPTLTHSGGGGGGGAHFHAVSSPARVSEHLTAVGEKMLRAGQALAALRFFDLAGRLQQRESLSLLRAEALVAVGRMDEAQGEANRFLRLKPEEGRAHFLLGKVYLHQERYEEARRHFTLARRFLPETDPQRGALQGYLEFNQIYLDRDALHTRDLGREDYVQEIENLRSRALALRSVVQTSPSPDLRGMEPHLDHLDNLFQSWLRELAANDKASSSSEPSRHT